MKQYKFKFKNKKYGTKFLVDIETDKGKIILHKIHNIMCSYDYDNILYKEITNKLLIKMLWDFNNKSKIMLAINLIKSYE